MSKDYEALLADSTVPEHLREGLALYVTQGYRPGSFLLAVLRNDLLGVFQYGDDTSVAGLKAIVGWLFDYAPDEAWGSPDRVDAWMRTKRQVRGRP